MQTDAQLLRRYLDNQDEGAFAALVQGHLGMVHAAALRRCGGRAVLAEEVSQLVFCALARKARSLVGHPSLTGWLYLSTRYACIDVLRAEQRRARLAESLIHMQDEPGSDSTEHEWQRLRPLLDEALDRLKEGERELMLLRYFEGRSFAELGAQFRIAENTARMRTERALEKLRVHLGRRGLNSSSAALGLLLSKQAFCSAPQGMAAAISTAALTQATHSAASGILSLLLMSKFTAPGITALAAAALTFASWSVFADDPAASVRTLREDNARLRQALAPGASEQLVTAEARDYGRSVSAVATAVRQRQARREAVSNSSLQPGAAAAKVSTRGHRYRGQATPHDAFMSFAWADDAGDDVETAKLIWFDVKERARALEILASMPESIREQFKTPEHFYGFLFVADALVAPPPGADMLERFEVRELSPGRVGLCRPGGKSSGQEYQQTAEGWKFVVPMAGVENAPKILTNETLGRLSVEPKP